MIKERKKEKIIKMLILLFLLSFTIIYFIENKFEIKKIENLSNLNKNDLNKKIKFEAKIDKIYHTKNNHTILYFKNTNITGIIFNNKIKLDKNKKYIFYGKINLYKNQISIIIFKINKS